MSIVRMEEQLTTTPSRTLHRQGGACSQMLTVRRDSQNKTRKAGTESGDDQPSLT